MLDIDARMKMKRTKSISLIAAALLAVSPVVASGITGETTVNAAKISRHAKKHVKKNVKKHVKKHAKKTTKKRSKKVKKAKKPVLNDTYNKADKKAQVYYRQVKANRYKQNGHWYVDLKAKVANIPTLNDDYEPTKYNIHNQAGQVYKLRTSDFYAYTDTDTNTVCLDIGEGSMYDLKNFTIIPKANGAKKNLASVMPISD